MNRYMFPRTYANLDAAPWCIRFMYDAAHIDNGGGIMIMIDDEWFSDDFFDNGGISCAYGETLEAALDELRRDLWCYMRPPAEAKASRKPL
tara:strand:- start:68 stop:340 length:273 start_codon:yes stop_codon:yes gene_type:complete